MEIEEFLRTAAISLAHFHFAREAAQPQRARRKWKTSRMENIVLVNSEAIAYLWLADEMKLQVERFVARHAPCTCKRNEKDASTN